MEFINWKANEEKKVAALVAGGYDNSYEGEAYGTVSGQYSNNSIRIPNEFFKVQQKREASQTQAQVDLIKISTDDAVKNKQADIDFLKVMADIQGAGVDQGLKQEKLDAENARTAVEMAVNVSAHHHDVEMSKKEPKLKPE